MQTANHNSQRNCLERTRWKPFFEVWKTRSVRNHVNGIPCTLYASCYSKRGLQYHNTPPPPAVQGQLVADNCSPYHLLVSREGRSGELRLSELPRRSELLKVVQFLKMFDGVQSSTRTYVRIGNQHDVGVKTAQRQEGCSVTCVRTQAADKVS